MKITTELRNISEKDLHARSQELKKELLKLNVGVHTGNAGNAGKIRQNKKNIARIITVLAENKKKGGTFK